MSGFDDYTDRFLAALYLEAEETGRDFHSARGLHEKYLFAPEREHWISRMADEWEHSYFKKVLKVLNGYDAWSFRLSADGYRKVEAEFRDLDHVRAFMSGLGEFVATAPSRGSDGSVSGGLAPAANRIVRLDHNRPEYTEVAEGLARLFEDVRSSNQVASTAEDRAQLLNSLAAAQQYWAAPQLYLIQVQIGVVMAVEEATVAMKRVGVAVGGAVIVDLVKKIVKDATGVQF